jgi:hexosaminidase
MYGLESLVQLADADTGMLPHGRVSVTDAPDYAWRGLMVDAGRRFFPMSLLTNLLHTMAAAKMNVLHLHASDMCRFGVESKVHPELTANLTGIHAGFYSQDDITELQGFAHGLGIRVVPEFDVPGHSRGWRPVATVDFCTQDNEQSQLFGSNATYDAVHAVLKEMSGLFTDEVFNIGCDETSATGVCTVESTFDFERRLFKAIAEEFQKTPEGWEEAYFDAGAATNATIVNAWSGHTASEIVAKGFQAVESKASAFYFTSPGAGGPAGWDR